MQNYYSLVARTLHRQSVFHDRALAHSMWTQVRLMHSHVVSCILMPNHLHLMVRSNHPDTDQQNLKHALRVTSAKFNLGKNYWEPVPQPTKVADAHHANRLLRYIYLNPCRANLTNDPLKWEWSTLRDSLDLRLMAWPNIAKEAALLNPRFAQQKNLLHYVNRDDSTAGNTANIRPATSNMDLQHAPHYSPSAIQSAIQAACNQQVRKKVERRYLVWLMKDQGFADQLQNKLVTGLSRWQIRRLSILPAPPLRIQRLLRVYLAHDLLLHPNGAKQPMTHPASKLLHH